MNSLIEIEEHFLVRTFHKEKLGFRTELSVLQWLPSGRRLVFVATKKHFFLLGIQ
jgi:hypothetical protein